MVDTSIYEEIEDVIFRSINASEAYKKIELILKENIKCIENVKIIITTSRKARSSMPKQEHLDNHPDLTKNKVPKNKNVDILTFPVSDNKRKYAEIEIFVSNKKEAEKELNDDFIKNLLDLLLYTYKRFHI